MTDAPERLVVDGLRELLAWIHAGATLEQRQARAQFVREAVDAVVAAVDPIAFNTSLRQQLAQRSDPFAASWASRQATTPRRN